MAKQHEVRVSVSDLGYLQGKLDLIHEDVKTLTTQVDELRQDHSGRKHTAKFIIGSLGVLGVVLGWVIDHILTLGKLIS